jgi:hypothetical protein
MHVSSVSLDSNGGGRTNILGFRWKDPQQRLVVLYCGEVAAGTNEGVEGKSSDGSPSDGDQERDIISRYSVDSDAAMSDARRIVSNGSAQIDSDARRLLRNGSL